jgi:hypothetical protein
MISNTTNSYTYIGIALYAVFSPGQTASPISGIMCSIPQYLLASDPALKKIQVTPEIQLEVDLCDLSLCMNLHVLSSCSDPLSLSLAKIVCAIQ